MALKHKMNATIYIGLPFCHWIPVITAFNGNVGTKIAIHGIST